jgi:phosphate transport system protein
MEHHPHEHIVAKFDKNLDKIKSLILDMGALVGSQIKDATALWFTYDETEAARIRSLDRQVNAMNREVYARAEVLIVRRQPMAMDLRETLAPINIASELERIGDHAKSLAKRAFLYTDQRPPKEFFDLIAQMSDDVQHMLSEVLIAYSNSDIEAAAKVREKDADVDAAHKKMLKMVIAALTDGPKSEDLTTELVHMVLISRNLERVGDHIVNIARFVNQIVEGDDLKAIE